MTNMTPPPTTRTNRTAAKLLLITPAYFPLLFVAYIGALLISCGVLAGRMLLWALK